MLKKQLRNSLKYMTSKNKGYPLILRLYGKLYRLQSFFGKWYFRRCDDKGNIIKKNNVVPFKK